MRFGFYSILLLSALSAFSAVNSAELPNTKPLTEEGNLATNQVAGMHKYLDRELAASVEKRQVHWKINYASPDAFIESVEPIRTHFYGVFGMTADVRNLVHPTALTTCAEPGQSPVVAETDRYTVYAVRWDVLPGVDGEGLLVEPKGKALGRVIAIPDADQTPEQVLGLAPGVPRPAQFARILAENNCTVLVPLLIDRQDTFSANPRLNRATNLPHREFVHRMAYQMGRTMIGYELHKLMAAVSWFIRGEGPPHPLVFGYGEGGLLALYLAAMNRNISAAVVSGSFGPREGIADEPIYHNVWGLLNEYGDGELLRLTYLRRVFIEAAPFSAAAGPPARAGRAGAAPGRSEAAPLDAVKKEAARGLAPLLKGFNLKGDSEWVQVIAPDANDPRAFRGPGLRATYEKLFAEMAGKPVDVIDSNTQPTERRIRFDPSIRQKRQFDQLVAYTQKLWRDSEATRKEFWKKADASSPEAWEKSCEVYREYFHSEVIGKLPEPTMPLNPRSRQVYDELKFTGYEVMLDVYPDVNAHGILLLPKDLKPGEKRPVVVCQHGLEGTPRDTINVEKRPVYNHFSRRLVEEGYIVFAPQNPYYGENVFRQLQRKANPLKLSLFSFIIRQHQRIIDWLETQPNVDPKRIAFYGLSYGGKTAMRVPAVEKRYCLSICSGDFNEWIGKNVSVDLDRSYMWTREYEMYEFDLGNTFNYAEMAFLIAPRPFMVERGHDDGVGTDEMVDYEYAKVRYLYANRLKIADRTEIEHFVGFHEIRAKGTFEFLAKHLNWKR